MATGVLFVTIIGISRTHESFVGNSGILKPLLLLRRHFLEKEMATYGRVMFTAWAMKVQLNTVNMQNGTLTATVITLKMHQSSAPITLVVLVSLQS